MNLLALESVNMFSGEVNFHDIAYARFEPINWVGFLAGKGSTYIRIECNPIDIRLSLKSRSTNLLVFPHEHRTVRKP